MSRLLYWCAQALCQGPCAGLGRTHAVGSVLESRLTVLAESGFPESPLRGEDAEPRCARSLDVRTGDTNISSSQLIGLVS